MKDELIQISGKAYQKCECIMLPTENPSSLFINTDTNLLEYYYNGNRQYFHKWQHLYILSSEEIKEGDWYMYCHFGEWIISNSRETLKNKTNTLENLNKDNYFKKIIATTDFELKTPDSGMKAGYYMKDSTPLPRPSDDFIKAFVNAQGKIDKVLVEYEGYGFKRFNLEGKPRRAGYQLKIAPDNTITIKPLQEEKTSWNREEVIKLLNKYGNYVALNMEARDNGCYFNGDITEKEWIEENFK
jgi:hypothetical protein